MNWEKQKVSDSEFVLWAWQTLQQESQPEEQQERIDNVCLSCGLYNVDEDHQCDGRQVA